MLVDDLEEPDVDILDITNPSKPKIVAETNLDTDRADRPGPAARRRRLQPRHGRQAHRRQGRHADVLLGRRLRHLDVTDPTRSPKVMSDTDFAAGRPGADRSGRRSRPRATPTRRSSPATTSSSSPPTRTSTRIRVAGHHHRRPGDRNRVHGHPGRGHRRRSTKDKQLVGPHALPRPRLRPGRGRRRGERSPSSSAVCATSRSRSTTSRPPATRA